MSKHGAVIKFNSDTFLKMLDFEGGVIHSIKLEEPYLPPEYIEILLEHPDLPEVKVGALVEGIKPIYQSTYGDNGGLIRVERTYPEKGIARDG